MLDLKTFYGPNAGYVLDLYERYKQNPASVDATTRALFETWSPNSAVAAQAMAGPPGTSTQWLVSHVVAAAALAHAIRERGHLGAHLDPLGGEPVGDPALLPETHGLAEEDLAQLPPLVVGGHAAEGARNALQATQALRAMYSGTISYEFDQVKSADERMWLRDAVGLGFYHRTPKSLLRHPLATSRLEDLAEGIFQPVLDDPRARVHAKRVKRVILCTGKMAIDLLAHQSRETTEDVAIVRIEMLYPFPAETLKKVLARYPNKQEVVWVQEEPHNMGAWSYMAPQLSPLLDSHLTLDVISRPERASPATGFWDLYMAEQEQITTEASSMPLGQYGGDYVH